MIFLPASMASLEELRHPVIPEPFPRIYGITNEKTTPIPGLAASSITEMMSSSLKMRIEWNQDLSCHNPPSRPHSVLVLNKKHTTSAPSATPN